MKKIICFGDSNTFGFNPKDGSRYTKEKRWTGLLACILKDNFNIVEEGCNNRTGFFLSPDGELQSGQKYLPKCVEKHSPFDIFIFALGTNDLQKFFDIDENLTKDGLKNTITYIRKITPQARIILISPVILGDDLLKGYFQCQFDDKSICASIWIQDVYREIAKEEKCELLDINQFVSPSPLDGLHFDEKSHKIIAEKIADKILSNKNEKIETFTKGNINA